MSLNKKSALFTYQKNGLQYEGQSLIDLEVVQNYQKPIFIYRMGLIQKRLDWVKQWAMPHRLHFAMKSNYSPDVLKLMLKNKAGVDVVSLGEIKWALQMGFQPQDIVFSGVGKTVEEITWAVQNKVYQINVESIPELKRIEKIATALNSEINIGLRVNPEVDAKTHPNIATALIDSKFGLSMTDLEQVKQILKASSYLKLVALSFHLGSQIQDVEVLRQALQKMKPLYQAWQKEFSALQRFDLGGGLGIDYKNHDENDDSERWQKLKQIYDTELADVKAFYLLELGRFIVARSAILICQIQYIKKTQTKNMIILDVGMNNLMRPMLYQAFHQIYPLIKHEGELQNYSVVGPLCESSDVIHDVISLSELHEGDLLAIADAGAYAKSMSSNYNLQPIAEDYYF